MNLWNSYSFCFSKSLPFDAGDINEFDIRILPTGEQLNLIQIPEEKSSDI